MEYPKLGNKTPEVYQLQKALIEALGKQALPKYGADRGFGAETTEALKLYQRVKKLPVTGIVDKETWAALFPQANGAINVSPELLGKIAPNASKGALKVFAPLITIHAAKPENNVTTILRMCTFLSQILHESGSLKWLREIYGPTKAQLGYEGRQDLGNVIRGDGQKFIGRGILQVTGRANYAKVSKKLFGDDRLLGIPELLEVPENAVASAFIWWTDNKMNAIADKIDPDNPKPGVTIASRRVNGGTNGLEDRYAFFQRAFKLLS